MRLFGQQETRRLCTNGSSSGGGQQKAEPATVKEIGKADYRKLFVSSLLFFTWLFIGEHKFFKK